jgi:kynurenine formamidase
LRTVRLSSATLLVGILTFGSAAGAGDRLVIDLTHAIPTFAPSEQDPRKPDLAKPFGPAEPVPTFGQQAVYEVLPDWDTGQGHFYAGRSLIYDHHGTHLDAPTHYRNDAETLEVKEPDRRGAEALSVEDLVGPIIFLDIGARVRAELGKNQGEPSPDTEVTDFSNDSENVVTPSDVDSLADRLEDRAWIVVHTGWSRFFRGASLEETPYVNGWNYPGFNRKACDRLIEIEDRKGIRINGIAVDNIGIESGESSSGTHPWHCHVRGLQRGWKFVENATNLDQLARAKTGSCTLVVGAPKHVAGSGGSARVLALCEAD